MEVVSKTGLDILVQSLPPVPDAIGEYTACFASQLTNCFRVNVFTNKLSQVDHIGGVAVKQCFELNQPSGRRFDPLFHALEASDSTILLLQYNPFAWGRRGWAPDLPRLLARVKRRKPNTLLVVMFHETFMMFPGLRYRIMRFYQERQYKAIVRLADVCFFSTSKWADICRRDFPSKKLHVLPVGSNLPKSPLSQRVAKTRLRVASDDFVCCVFGGGHISRMFDRVDSAVRVITDHFSGKCKVHLVYIGDANRDWKCGEATLHRLGRLTAPNAADAIAAADLMINPFLDGLSTRRGSAMAALQHGVPVLGTHGASTEAIWSAESMRSVCLVSPQSEADWLDASIRYAGTVCQLGDALRTDVQRFYESNFDWPVTTESFAEKVHEHLNRRSG